MIIIYLVKITKINILSLAIEKLYLDIKIQENFDNFEYHLWECNCQDKGTENNEK